MNADSRRVVVVLAAVIERDDAFLLTRRLAGTHLAGLWEFPGGKCEPDETHEDCLTREVREELGVEATIGAEILVTEHAYPDRIVRLHFRHCRLLGEPQALLSQDMQWIPRAALRSVALPPADDALVELLMRHGA